MSDPKRATLITVGATKSEKNNVHKTVRLTINLDESNESKYPELNYKELVIAEERKKKVENGKINKPQGLDPFSDNDEDVERVARKFEQKYGGKSTYGRKGRSKRDDFADIGAGYDENDSFIDNTDGYDEMIPPDYDTFYGGFYINSGSLEFKNVKNASMMSDDDGPGPGRRNKRRISSSSSEADSSDSSSESQPNGGTSEREEKHRKKNKVDKKPKKIRRTDSSAATSGKQTSDDNNVGLESADSRTSHSDSLTSKPARSSENPATSDSSRDAEAKGPSSEPGLPAAAAAAMSELITFAARLQREQPTLATKDLLARCDHLIAGLERALSSGGCGSSLRRVAYTRAAQQLRVKRTQLLQRARQHVRHGTTGAKDINEHKGSTTSASQTTVTSTEPANTNANVDANPSSNAKRKADDDMSDEDMSRLTDLEREAKIVEALQRLKDLIEERKPGMMANYNAECERVQEERKKLQMASAAEGAPAVEKRLPKRRFPWCARSRALLSRLRRLAMAGGGGASAACSLLATRALPLFPSGFVRMPTLLRQADLNKELKSVEMKRQRLGSASQPTPQPVTHPPSQSATSQAIHHQPDSMPFTENIHFPSSLTVTTMKPEKTESLNDKDKFKTSLFGTVINLPMNKDLVVEKEEPKKDVEPPKEDIYIPPNNIGCITITPVPNNTKEKSVIVTEKRKEGLIRVKSPAALNEMVNKKEKDKALENIHKRDKDKHKKDKNHSSQTSHASQTSHSSQNTNKEKRLDVPLQIETNFPAKQKDPTPSPKNKFEEIPKRQIENMRIAENNIPKPALVPVKHSPTFIKPDKRPPELKKKKDLVILSDIDPLGDVQQEPVAIDDSSSDVEVVEDKSDVKSDDKSEYVPSKDKVSVREVNHTDDTAKSKDARDSTQNSDKLEKSMQEDFDSVMKSLRDLEHSQEASKLNNSFGGIITSEPKSLNKMDGCSAITG